jgi:hypothetical protein
MDERNHLTGCFLSTAFFVVLTVTTAVIVFSCVAGPTR